MENISLADLGFENGQRKPPSTTLPTTPSTTANGKLQAGLTTSVEDRALQLLGSGISAEAAANALGVTPSRISQLLSEQHFSDRVATLRYENLQKHNTRDNAYDAMEDVLLDKLEQQLPFLLKPGEILKALQVTNNAKRRGQSAPDQTINQQNIVNLVLPEVIAQRFTVNIDNQVTRAGEQELHTMPASDLLKTVEKEEAKRLEVLSHLESPIEEGDITLSAL